MRFVCDTNVLVSACLKPLGIPAKSLLYAKEIGQLVFSPLTLKELKDVLGRPHLRKYLKQPQEVIVTAIVSESYHIEDVSNSAIYCRDEKDIKFLNVASLAKADCLISGDSDLLVLHPFRNIPIYNPSDFLNNF